MKDKALVAQDWDDLVFENRNKDYGAYTLRKKYSVSVIEATMITLALAVFIFLLPGLVSRLFGNELPLTTMSDPIVELVEKITIIPKAKEKIISPPPQRKIKGGGTPVVTTSPVDSIMPTPNQLPVDPGTLTGNPNVDPTTVVEPPTGGGGTGVGTAVVETPDPVLDFAEIMPEYIGGYKAMSRFLGDRIKYPHSARRMGTEGKVFVQFVVQKDGSVSDVKIARGIQGELDREAARVIALMPNWKPARMGQRNVAVKMMLPVSFHLDNN